MHAATIIALACLIATAVAAVHYEQYPAVDAVRLPEGGALYDSIYDTPALERSPRTKRGLLLLKKKLLLGALGLKAAKIAAVGAGAAGIIALKSKSKSVPRVKTVYSYGYSSHAPSWTVDVHRWLARFS